MPDRVSNLAKQLRTKKTSAIRGCQLLMWRLGQQGDMEIMFIKKTARILGRFTCKVFRLEFLGVGC